MVKNPLAKQEPPLQSLGPKDPLEKEITTHTSILAWEIPWTEEPGGLPSMGPLRVRHNLATECAWPRTRTYSGSCRSLFKGAVMRSDILLEVDSRAVVLKVWSLNQQQQYSLGLVRNPNSGVPSRPAESESEVGPSNMHFHRPSKWLQCTVKFEDPKCPWNPLSGTDGAGRD